MLNTTAAWATIIACFIALLLWMEVKPPSAIRSLLSRGTGDIPMIAGKRNKLILALIGATWLWCGVITYKRYMDGNIPEFDSKFTDPYLPAAKYGLRSPGICFIVANGKNLRRYASYKMAPACVLLSGAVDKFDAPIMVGSTHPVDPDSNTNMEVSLSQQYLQGMRSGSGNAFGFYILLIPQDVEISEFNTFKTARKLGVKILFAGAQ